MLYNALAYIPVSLTGDTPGAGTGADATAVSDAINTLMNAAGTVWTWMVAHPFTLIGVALGIIAAGAAIIRTLTGQRRRRGR